VVEGGFEKTFFDDGIETQPGGYLGSLRYMDSNFSEGGQKSGKD